MRIPISKPWFGPEERDAITKPLDSGWVVQGPWVQSFEQKFAAFTGAEVAVATTSCTTALHLAVAVMELKPGDEVIVPAFTWVATANVVECMGARPVFCDIDLDTYNLNPKIVETLISPRTVGIIPVHLFGLCANMNRILEIAASRGLWVVEDAACGFGATIRGRHAGTFGDLGCFSFHPRKALTTGEGGMVTTMRPELGERARSLRDHGASRAVGPEPGGGAHLLPEFNLLGYNYRMTDFQGALGAAQMDRSEAILETRRRQAAQYDERLAGMSWLRRPVAPEGYGHGYQSYVTLYSPDQPTLANVGAQNAGRNHLMARLESKGIATRQGTHAAALTGYYARKYALTPAHFPNAYLAEQLTIALPLYAGLREDEVTEICDVLAEVDAA